MVGWACELVPYEKGGSHAEGGTQTVFRNVCAVACSLAILKGGHSKFPLFNIYKYLIYINKYIKKDKDFLLKDKRKTTPFSIFREFSDRKSTLFSTFTDVRISLIFLRF